jgi:glucose/arabinose dehydrogenase
MDIAQIRIGARFLYIIKKEKIFKIQAQRHSYENIYSILIIFLSVILLLCFFSPFLESEDKLYAQNQNLTVVLPTISDPNLKVELVAKNFDFPTTIEFLGKDDILLLEKNTGNVYRIVNGNVSQPLIHIDVTSKDERGLLGIAVSGKENDQLSNNNSAIFLYFTQCTKGMDGTNNGTGDCSNFIYRYKLDTKNNKLIDPRLLLKLPALPGPSHNGGVLEMDKDKNLYVAIGDLQTTAFNQNQAGFDTKAQNIINGTPPDGRAGILRITEDGKPVGNGILGNQYPLNLYYAYGIKNSFGIGFDPLTGNLWDTENGPQFGDEINLVEPGFNSGWEKVQGIWVLNQTRDKEGVLNNSSKMEFVNFNGKGKYSNPEFVWDKSVAPTALVFLNSNKLGQQYQNDIFVGSVKKGVIYHFDLNQDRKSLSLDGDLADKILSKKDDASKIIFGKDFGVITDLEVGTDGYLYVVSSIKETDKGAIYRIVPR